MRFFELFEKTKNDKLSKPFHEVVITSFSNFHIEFENVGQETERFQKFEYEDNEMSTFGKIKSIFHIFKGLIFW